MSRNRKRKAKKAMAPLRQQLYTTPYTIKDPKRVMTINGVNIYGSPAYEIAKIPNLKLVIDMSGLRLPERQIVTGNAAAQMELPQLLSAKSVPTIYIGWADGTAHSLTVAWWETLITVIEELPEGSSVAVCCAGGTGRTGTVLAVLAGLTAQLSVDEFDPVKWVRDHYYDDAVETEVQICYVESLTGFLVESDPSESLYLSRMYPLYKPGPIPGYVSPPQGTVTGPLGPPASVGASDHTGA